MKVKFVKTGETVTVDDSYAARLIEYGKAIPVKGKPFMNEPVAEEEPEAAKPKGGKNRKGE